MASLARTLMILTLPAAAVGATIGLALRAATDVPDDAGGPVPLTPAGGDATEADPPRATGRGSRDGDGSGSARSHPRAGGTRRVVGNGSGGADVVPLDPSFGERLSAADEPTRLACALELLRMGPSRAAAVDLLATSTPAGGRLRDAIVNALTTLGRIEAGEDFAFQSDEAKLGVTLKHWGSVVPPSMLRAERASYWTQVVASDPDRLAAGGIEPGEAAWHRLELAWIRRELGTIGEDDWTKLRAEQIDAFSAWVAALELGGTAGASRLREAKSALARMSAK